MAVNRGEAEQRVELPVWELGLTAASPVVSLFETGRGGYSAEAKIYPTENGILSVALPPESSFVWKKLLPIGNVRNKESLEYNFK